MKKKVLFVITKSVWGGAGKYVYDLATNLPTDRFDIAVAAGGDGTLFQKLDAASVRTIHIPELDRDIHIGKEFRSFYALLKLFRQEQPDIIHLNSSKIGGLGALAGRIVSWQTGRKIKVIFTAHGWAFFEDRSLLWRTATFFLSWISTLFHDNVILINSRDYAAARKFIPARKLRLIFNGIYETDFLPHSTGRAFFTTWLDNLMDGETILVGTIAELTPNKGLAYLIDAASFITKHKPYNAYKIFIIGEGEQRPELETKIKKLGLEKVIMLLGFNTDARLAIGGLDIFVLASLKEGLPYAIMEAMAAGTPVIASNVGGIPDLISNNETGILTPAKDPQAIAEAIMVLAQNPERRASLAKCATETIRTKFSLHAMLKNTEKLYESMEQ